MRVTFKLKNKNFDFKLKERVDETLKFCKNTTIESVHCFALTKSVVYRYLRKLKETV